MFKNNAEIGVMSVSLYNIIMYGKSLAPLDLLVSLKCLKVVYLRTNVILSFTIKSNTKDLRKVRFLIMSQNVRFRVCQMCDIHYTKGWKSNYAEHHIEFVVAALT